MDEKTQKLKGLLNEAGAHGLDSVQVIGFDIGRGLISTTNFKKSETILSIPIQYCWKAQDLFDHPVLGDVHGELTNDDCLAILLMYYSVHRLQSTLRDKVWSAHIDLLPKTYSNSIYFTPSELEWAQGSSLYTIDHILREQIEQDYNKLVKIFTLYPNIFPIHLFTLDLYKWSLCTIWSRGMDFQVPQPNGTRALLRTIVPFMDFINGSLNVDQCHQYNPYTGMVQVLAGTSFKQNEQIFIYYGSIHNARLCWLYGFVFEGNVHDCYELVLLTHPNSPFFERKVNLFEQYGMVTQSIFKMTIRDPLPQPILQYLRIQRADEDELGLCKGKMGKLNRRNEFEVLDALQTALDGLIQQFHSKEELKRVIEKGGNARQCAIVALGELEILEKALSVYSVS